jgi:hypothetical protein
LVRIWYARRQLASRRAIIYAPFRHWIALRSGPGHWDAGLGARGRGRAHRRSEPNKRTPLRHKRKMNI